MKTIIILLFIVAAIAFYFGRKSSSSKDSNIQNMNNKHAHLDYDEAKEDNDRDAWEGGFWEASDPKKLNAHLRIEYKDGNGITTTRSVKVREFDNELYGGIIMGYCELRNATRTFRFDRIRTCTDLNTGEVVQSVKKHLNDLYEKSPERSAELLLSDYIDVLKAVYYIAKADGQFRKDEKEVISAYVRKLVRDDRITFDLIDNVIKEIETPTLHAFKLAVGRIIKGGSVDPDLLFKCCREIVDTQQKIHPMEKEALDYLDKKLASIKTNNTK